MSPRRARLLAALAVILLALWLYVVNGALTGPVSRQPRPSFKELTP